MAKKILTLNIGATNVTLAEYDCSARGTLTLTRYGQSLLAAPLDGGNTETILTPAILEVVRATGIRPGKVNISIPGQMVFPKFAAIPLAGGAERFESMVRIEIEQNIPFPIDEMVCDRQVLGETQSGDTSVMIVAAKVDQLEAICSAVAAVGFSPEVVDASPIALANSVRAVRSGAEEECVIVLDIGARTTSLVIVEGDKLYNRSIPVAGNAITKEIAAALGCSQEDAERIKKEQGYVSLGGVTEDADEMADRVSKVCRAVMTRLNAEITRSINFYRSQQGGAAPVKLYLAGGTSLLPQAGEFFAESLGVEVEIFNPFEIVKVASSVDAEAVESDVVFLGVNTGLALRDVDNARFAINLLPPSIIAERAEKARIPALLAAGVMFVSALVCGVFAINRERSVIEARRAAVSAVASKLSAMDKKVESAEKAANEAEKEAEDFRKLLVGRSVAIHRLSAIKDSLLPGMWIEKWSEDGKITVRFWRDKVKDKLPEGTKTVGEYVVDRVKAKGVALKDGVSILDMSTLGSKSQVDQFTLEVKFK